MKPFTFCIAILSAMALVGAAWAGKDTAEPQLRVQLDLADGSHIIGAPAIDSVPVHTPYAKMDVPLKEVLAIKMGDDHETAALDLRNGDKIRGVIDLKPLKLETVFGKVAVGIEHIKQVDVLLVRATGPLPLFEGTTSIPDGEAREWTFASPRASNVVLHLEAHIKWSQLAGDAGIMDLKVNGLAIPKSALVNKPLQFTYADGRLNCYHEISEEGAGRWHVFYSPEFGDNDSGASGYAVREKMSCIYEFDITALLRPGGINKITLRNAGERARQLLGKPLPIMCRDVRLILQ